MLVPTAGTCSWVLLCQEKHQVGRQETRNRRQISSTGLDISNILIMWKWKSKVLPNSLQPHGPYSSWNSPGQNTGVGSRSLLQGIFPTQGSNPDLPHGRQILYQLSHHGNLKHGLLKYRHRESKEIKSNFQGDLQSDRAFGWNIFLGKNSTGR